MPRAKKSSNSKEMALVGQRVKVWFDDKKKEYTGLVSSYESTSELHTVVWDKGQGLPEDGSIEEVELNMNDKDSTTSDERWSVVPKENQSKRKRTATKSRAKPKRIKTEKDQSKNPVEKEKKENGMKNQTTQATIVQNNTQTTLPTINSKQATPPSNAAELYDLNRHTLLQRQSTTRLPPRPTTNRTEKRLAIYKSSCPQKILERIQRAQTQRMYLISRKPPTDYKREFTVLGSIGNVYDVVISHIPSCTCPDNAKGNLCKHILLVYLKVLKVPPSSPYIYQKALLSSELEEIFTRAPKDPLSNVLASPEVQQKYSEITGEKVTVTNNSSKPTRKPVEGNMCPICYEDMSTDEELVYCESSCGQNVHKNCFDQWMTVQKKKGEEVTCVYCRERWKSETASAPKGKVSKIEGYINLQSFQPGLSNVRDSSTYNLWDKYYEY